jgi:FkbM family methyltransferase
MSESQLAEDEVASLKSAIEALSASEEEAELIVPRLRVQRRALAQKFLALGIDESRARFAASDGECLSLLVNSGLRNLERDAEDEALARRVLPLAGGAAPSPGPLLAAMLLFQAHELPPVQDLRAVPDWLLLDYVRFAISMPQVFLAAGDADRYCRALTEVVAAIERYVGHDPALPMAAQVSDLFLGESRFLQVYFNETNLRDLYRCRARIMERWALGQGAQLAHVFPLRAAAPAGRRLRVGILNHHFGPQTETYFMLAHFERFPRERSSLFLYALQDPPVPLSQYARSLADATVDLPADNVAAAAQRVRADDLDVLLIGTNVTVAFSHLSVLAGFRLARVQVISASSPVTSGLTTADWYLSAEDNETGDSERHYTEQLYRMPGMLTRYAYHLDKDPRTVTLDRGDLGIPKNAVVFFSASNFFKVIPEMSAAWARILGRVPGAWLVLMPFNRNWSSNYLSQPFIDRVLRQVKEAGGDPDRVRIMDALPSRADLHGVMSQADVYLDSYPFAGACSLLDPLLVGLPLVARTGQNFRSGVGAGMLHGLGIGDMALPDEATYVERAVALGKSAELRKRERARIQAAVSPRNPVFDSETGSRNMEAAFVDMAARAEALDAALLRQSPARLREAVTQISGELAREDSSWFRALNDVELIRQLAVPYFQSLPGDGAARHMLDVGACVGQIAEPFLMMGWKADLFEPDPACRDALAALQGRYAGRAAVHHAVIGSTDTGSVTFYQSTTGLSGLSPSPYGPTASTLTVPALRLSEHVRSRGLEQVDFLKVDCEGWDFDALRTHDFEAAPPRLAMVEFGTEFPRQSMDAVLQGIADMAAKGYEALVFSYEDDGNFKRQVWRYRLIAAELGKPVKRRDGHAGGNILFFRRDDVLFLALVLRVLVGFLPACERPQRYAGLE